MALVPAKCPNCGGMIQIESGNRAGICAFCKQPFVSEDAINNYNTYNNTYNHNTYNIENADLHIVDESNIDKKLESAETFLLKLNDYNEARQIFEDVSRLAPERYEAWYGLVRVATKNFECNTITSVDDPRMSESFYRRINIDLGKAIKVAPESKKQEIKQSVRKYLDATKTIIDNYSSDLEKEREMLLKEKDSIAAKLTAKEEEDQKIRKEIGSIQSKQEKLKESFKTKNNGSLSAFSVMAGLCGGGMVLGLFYLILGGSSTMLMLCFIGIIACSVLEVVTDKMSKQSQKKAIDSNEKRIEELNERRSEIARIMADVSGDPYWESQKYEIRYSDKERSVNSNIQKCNDSLHQIEHIINELR